MSKPQHATPGHEHDRHANSPAIDIDVAKAHRQGQLIHAQVAALPALRARLLEAKLAGEPAAIRLAAADLERAMLLLEVADAAIAHSIMLPGGDAQELVDDLETARRVAKQLALEVIKARRQAELVEAARDGEVPVERREASSEMSPTETRLRAAAVAPQGYCDDPELQQPDSHACPLDEKQRARTRKKVVDRLNTMATDWKDAILANDVKEQIAELTRNHGLPPMVELLLDVATGFIAGKASSSLITLADRQAVGLSELARVRGANTVMMPLTGTQGARKLVKDHASTITGFGKKLADRARKSAMGDTGANVSLTEQLDNVVFAWHTTATDDVDQLIDPDLVVVAEHLSESQFDRRYFDRKIAALVAAYGPLAKLGTADAHGRQPTRLAWVTSPGYPARLATYRPHGCDHGPIECAVQVVDALREQDRWTFLDFDQWVDPSMYALALARSPEPLRIDDADSRWARGPLQWTARDDKDGFAMVGLNPGKDLR
jgi:hypothetical protein